MAQTLVDHGTALAARRPMILTLAFDSPSLAYHALQAALHLHDAEQLQVHDAIVLSDAGAGGDVVATMDPTPLAAAVPATLVGALVGTLVAGPLGMLIGGALAGGSGALVAKLVDTGIPHHVVHQLRASIRPGQSVVALLVSDRRDGALVEFASRCAAVGHSTLRPYE